MRDSPQTYSCMCYISFFVLIKKYIIQLILYLSVTIIIYQMWVIHQFRNRFHKFRNRCDDKTPVLLEQIVLTIRTHTRYIPTTHSFCMNTTYYSHPWMIHRHKYIWMVTHIWMYPYTQKTHTTHTTPQQHTTFYEILSSQFWTTQRLIKDRLSRAYIYIRCRF